MGIKKPCNMDRCIRRKHLTIMVQVGVFSGLIQSTRSWGVFPGYARAHRRHGGSKACRDLFMGTR